MAAKKKIALVGATGIAGQQFVAALAGHPWFDITRMVGSERSARKRYGDALRDPKTGARRWWCEVEPPAPLLDLEVEDSSTFEVDGVDLVFSAVEADVARELEPATRVRRLSSAPLRRSATRTTPIPVPGVNWDHARLLDLQRERRGWRGYITPIPQLYDDGARHRLEAPARRWREQGAAHLDARISEQGAHPEWWHSTSSTTSFRSFPRKRRRSRARRGRSSPLGEGGLRDAEIVVSATCTRR
jgi:aspartate-semialdehyde dehydrogenase